METLLCLCCFYSSSDCFTEARWLLHATHIKTLWSSYLRLALKISAVIGKLAQLKCSNHDGMLLLSKLHTPN